MTGPTSSPVPLLGPDDPPPAAVVNRDGRAPLLLLCDHASAAIPKRLGTLGLGAVELGLHIAYDIGAAAVARQLSQRFDAPLVLSGYSRLVIDCNRRPADATSIPPVSDGVVVPGNQSLTPADRTQRRESCFEPYHAAIDSLLATMVARHRHPIVLSVHSCTPVMNGVHRPWHIGVLWDDDARVPVPLMAALARDLDICVGDNQPYSGRNHHGYTIDAHVAPRALPHASVEVRQDLIADVDGQARWAAKLGDALAAVLAGGAGPGGVGR